MATEILSAAAILNELKHSGSKFEKANSNVQFVCSSVGNKAPTGFATLDEFAATAKTKKQSILDTIKRKNSLKKALVVSNATTPVVVAGVSMTVAEAIERKSSISLEKAFITNLQKQLDGAIRTVDRANAEVQQNLDRILTASVSKDSKNLAEETEAISVPYLARNGAKIFDPINVKKLIEELSTEVADFEAAVDLALNTSNAITMIEVEV